MPKIVDENERQNEIANAAVNVFAENGFSETNVKQIADRAGMSKGNIYLYFDSKEEILHQVFLNFESALHETLDGVLSGADDPTGKIESLISDLTDLIRANRPTIRVLFDFWSYSLHSEDQDLINYEEFYRRIEQKLEELIQEGTDDGIFRADWDEELPSMLIGFFEGQLVQWLVNPGSPSLEIVERTGTHMLLEGLSSENN